MGIRIFILLLGCVSLGWGGWRKYDVEKSSQGRKTYPGSSVQKSAPFKVEGGCIQEPQLYEAQVVSPLPPKEPIVPQKISGGKKSQFRFKTVSSIHLKSEGSMEPTPCVRKTDTIFFPSEDSVISFGEERTAVGKKDDNTKETQDAGGTFSLHPGGITIELGNVHCRDAAVHSSHALPEFFRGNRGKKKERPPFSRAEKHAVWRMQIVEGLGHLGSAGGSGVLLAFPQFARFMPSWGLGSIALGQFFLQQGGKYVLHSMYCQKTLDMDETYFRRYEVWETLQNACTLGAIFPLQHIYRQYGDTAVQAEVLSSMCNLLALLCIIPKVYYKRKALAYPTRMESSAGRYQRWMRSLSYLDCPTKFSVGLDGVGGAAIALTYSMSYFVHRNMCFMVSALECASLVGLLTSFLGKFHFLYERGFLKVAQANQDMRAVKWPLKKCLILGAMTQIFQGGPRCMLWRTLRPKRAPIPTMCFWGFRGQDLWCTCGTRMFKVFLIIV